MTTKRAPEMRLAASKSMPRRAPTATWSLGSNSNVRGAPQRRISRLSASSRPGGTLACRMFGIPSCTSDTCACIRSSSTSSPVSLADSDSPSANRGAASRPCALACPVALALALRSARIPSASTCAALRRSSSPAIASTSSTNPRRPNSAATFGNSARNNLGSSTLFLPRVFRVPAPHCRRPSRHRPTGRPFLHQTRSRARRAASASPILISRPRGAGT